MVRGGAVRVPDEWTRGVQPLGHSEGEVCPPPGDRTSHMAPGPGPRDRILHVACEEKFSPLGHSGGGVQPPGDKTWLRVGRRQLRGAKFVIMCGDSAICTKNSRDGDKRLLAMQVVRAAT